MVKAVKSASSLAEAVVVMSQRAIRISLSQYSSKVFFPPF